MKGADVTSSASREDYINWVFDERLQLSEEDQKAYYRLVQVLLDIEFVWVHPMDENRASDGLSMREDFTYETGLYLDGSSGLMPCCTVFEMLAALAYRCESQIMLDYSVGYRVSRWWKIMLENLGIADCTDLNWKRNDDNYIRDCVEKFMHREYKTNGTGGLFKVKNKKFNCKTEEIWKQCMAFLNENYQ